MEESIGSVMADAARLIRRTFDERARTIGVTRPQWQVLTTLSRHEGVNQGSLAEMLDVEPITLCRMLDRLQDAQLVERRRDPDDRRAWLLFLQPEARKLLQEMRPLGHEVMNAALKGFSKSERETLHDLLDRIRHNLSRRNPDN